MIKLENILIAFYGITTVIVFIAMVVVGGLFNSFHTLFFREVSFLISPYSFNSAITIPLYRIYNLHLFIFALILFIRIRNIFARIGSLYLSLSAVMSLLLIYYPMDPIGTSQTFSGSLHVRFVLVTGLYIAVALVFFGFGFKKNKNLALLSSYSTEISLIILFAGFLTGAFALRSMAEYVGFFQKLPIAVFLLWILLTSFWVIKSDHRLKYAELNKKKIKRNRKS